VTDAPESVPPSARPGRWRRLLVIAAVVLVALAAAVVATIHYAGPLSQWLLSDALGVPVSVGSLAFNFREPTLVATDVALGPADDRLSAAHLAVTTDIRALLARRIVLDEVTIDGLVATVTIAPGPQVTVAGLPRPAAQKTPADSEGLGHLVTIHQVRVTDASLTVHHALQDKPATVAVRIDELAAKGLAVRSDGGDLHLDADLDGTADGVPFKAHVTASPAGGDQAIDVRAEVKRITLPTPLLDLPKSLSGLTGSISGALTYHSDRAKRESWAEVELHADAPKLAGAADTQVSARGLDVERLRIDVQASTIDLGRIAVDRPALSVALTPNGVVLPLASPDVSDGASTEWRLIGGKAQLTGGSIAAQRGDQRFEIALDAASWDGIASGQTGTIRLNGRPTGGGTVSVSGTLQIAPVAISLQVSGEKMSMPRLADVLPGLPLRLTKGTVSGSVSLNGPPQALQTRAQLGLDEIETAPPVAARPNEVIACNRVEAELSIDPQGRGVEISALRLSYPYVMVQRSAEGVFPYSVFGAGGTGTAAASTDVRIKSTTIEGGRADFLDHTVEPAYWTALADLAANAVGVDLPGPEVGDFHLAARQDEINPIEITGTANARGWQVQLNLQAVFLPTLNAYVAPLLGYKADSGVLSLDISGQISGRRLRTTNRVTLRNVSFTQTGLDIIQRSTGVPLPIALALLKDPSGTIELVVPIEGKPQAGRFWLGSLIDQALSKAVLGALSSPLKLLGLLFGTDGPTRALAIDPVPFAPGSATLDAMGGSRLQQIARILAAHTELTLVAKAEVSSADAAIVGNDGLQKLAAQRAEAVKDALVAGKIEPRVPADRLVISPWTPAPGEALAERSGVYVEMQLSADYGN
jgi:uncharacterized protein DUF748